ncbi:cupin domain-containing protein [Sedimentitalea sp. XS_ASV28]|uniref:cupin domain-containing protein n=1 Tax=Sedimentitalea sp. XS_ASV28 TaxID=3241296 RepID=UPI003511B263
MCLIPRFNGVILSQEWKDALWDKFVVRRDRRRKLDFESGIRDELLSPNLARGIELLRCTFRPHSISGKEDYSHKGEEAGFVVSGKLTLWLDGKEISLESGDSFAFESSILNWPPFRPNTLA